MSTKSDRIKDRDRIINSLRTLGQLKDLPTENQISAKLSLIVKTLVHLAEVIDSK